MSSVSDGLVVTSKAGVNNLDSILDKCLKRPLCETGSRAGLYFKNFLYVSHGRNDVVSKGRSHGAALEGRSLPTHELIFGENQADYVGLHVDGSSCQIRLA